MQLKIVFLESPWLIRGGNIIFESHINFEVVKKIIFTIIFFINLTYIFNNKMDNSKCSELKQEIRKGSEGIEGHKDFNACR
jgi:hypothetical protein